MTKSSSIRTIETLSCDAGWRNYHFVKITTEDGIVGWSEYDEGFGAPGVTAAIERISARVVGKNAFHHERIYAELFSATRPAAGGVVGLALGAIENALLDVKAKALGVPCYELLGGKIRDRIRVYWSHCATWRINHPTWYKPAITDLDGVKAIGREVREKRFTAMKTNIFVYTDGKPQGWRPGFGSPFEPEINVDRTVLRNLCMHLEAIRDGAGPDVDLLLDLNFNAKTEGYLKILRAIKDMDMFWVEIDSFNPQALGYIRRQSPHPISSCETLLGLREFLPYFSEQAMDVAIIDTPWNGVWQSMKIAAAAEHFEVNVAPHNFYGHLMHHDERPFLRGGAEFSDHGNRHRSAGVGPRAVYASARICRRPSRAFGPAGLGHRTQRGRPARPSREEQGRVVELRAGEEIGVCRPGEGRDDGGIDIPPTQLSPRGAVANALSITSPIGCHA
jgi:galactonate dehydratase